MESRLVDETLKNHDGGLSTDQSVMDLLKAKKKLADSVMDVMKYSAVDCELNNEENGKIACYKLPGQPSMEPLFHPLVDEHLNNVSATVRTVM